MKLAGYNYFDVDGLLNGEGGSLLLLTDKVSISPKHCYSLAQKIGTNLVVPVVGPMETTQ